MLLPHIKSSLKSKKIKLHWYFLENQAKKETNGYVDIRKWNGEGIPYSILLRNLQQFSHLIESDELNIHI
jgi:hypothetical protein